MTERGDVIYEARNLSKRYGAVVALDEANLKLHAGEVVGLVGDNGAGVDTWLFSESTTSQRDCFTSRGGFWNQDLRS